jgi:hypothetical protein
MPRALAFGGVLVRIKRLFGRSRQAREMGMGAGNGALLLCPLETNSHYT